MSFPLQFPFTFGVTTVAPPPARILGSAADTRLFKADARQRSFATSADSRTNVSR